MLFQEEPFQPPGGPSSHLRLCLTEKVHTSVHDTHPDLCRVRVTARLSHVTRRRSFIYHYNTRQQNPRCSPFMLHTQRTRQNKQKTINIGGVRRMNLESLSLRKEAALESGGTAADTSVFLPDSSR